MKETTFQNSIDKYLNYINKTDWIFLEAYKFQFANFLHSSVNFENQNDTKILETLIQSQQIKYSYGSGRGIQFILKSAKNKLSEFITIKDIRNFREFQNKSFDQINWKNREMSFPGLSAWLASLYPHKFYPIPMKGFNKTINYLFETNLQEFPITGEKYILECQTYFEQTEEKLRNYPITELYLKKWNDLNRENPELDLKPKEEFSKVDWVWLTQDFHLFIYRNILELYEPKAKTKEKGIGDKSVNLDEDFGPVVIEGKSKLAIHLRYERNSTIIKKIKERILKSNPMLNCEVCGFSFFEKYGELGKGFIEAHHATPLSETKSERKVTRKDINLVCSNCHKMIHRKLDHINEKGLLTIKELRNIISDN